MYGEGESFQKGLAKYLTGLASPFDGQEWQRHRDYGIGHNGASGLNLDANGSRAEGQSASLGMADASARGELIKCAAGERHSQPQFEPQGMRGKGSEPVVG